MSKAAVAARVVQDFFAAYRAHDVEAMVDACSDGADFQYIPFEIWGKQRVLRGDGKVRGIGKVLWTGLIDAFPDLGNQVTALHADDSGNVAAEVTIGGTQARVWGSIDHRGAQFQVPHLFLFRVGASGAIERIAAYWDSADMYRQLGRIEID
jgi:hypothetical protein